MKTCAWAGLCLSLSFVIPALSQGRIGPGPLRTVPFESLDQGEISYYRYGEEGFLGTDRLIRDRSAWARFWTAHTEGMEPQPPLPSVNFAKEMVVLAVLGFQTSGGGPGIDILEIKWDQRGKHLRVLIEDDETPGPLDVITNPYHIVKFEKLPVHSVVLEHQKPLAAIE